MAGPFYREWADWVVATCLQFGTTVATAYTVAGLFVQGISAPTDTAPTDASEGASTGTHWPDSDGA